MLIIDAHCDTILDLVREKRSLGERSTSGHVDIPRLKEAGVKLQFFAVFVESIFKPVGSLRRALQQIAVFHKEIEENKGAISLVTSKDELQEVIKLPEKIGAILSIEGGEALEGDMGVLECLYRLGVRSIGLTWNQRNALADGVGERHTRGGLSSFGRQVVKTMNSLGMIVDVAHLAATGFWDVLELSTKPVLVSHANCQSVYNHYRNLTDQQIAGLAQQKGVMGITFAPEFVARQADVLKIIEHIDHICQVTGSSDHIGIGSDFDGTHPMTAGLEDTTKLKHLITLLENKGYKYKDIVKIMGGNLLRLVKANLQ